MDSTDEERLLLANQELKRLLVNPTENLTASSSTQSAPSEGLGDVPFLLMYNKKDLADASKSS